MVFSHFTLADLTGKTKMLNSAHAYDTSLGTFNGRPANMIRLSETNDCSLPLQHIRSDRWLLPPITIASHRPTASPNTDGRPSFAPPSQTSDIENCILPVPDQWKNPIWNGPSMKKRQARKILNQVLRQGRPVNLPDGRRASKRAIRRAGGPDSALLAGITPQELKYAAALARRFDSARRRQERIFNRNFKRASRSRLPQNTGDVVANG